jgi:hypothetical protein
MHVYTHQGTPLDILDEGIMPVHYLTYEIPLVPRVPRNITDATARNPTIPSA